jgi:hypothetical protein
VKLAAFRDWSSGGVCRWIFINENGVQGDVDNWEQII